MAHEFTTQDGEFISYEDARDATKLYRENNLSTAVKAYYFGADKFREVIDQAPVTVIGIRIYHAYFRDNDSGLVPQVIIVGVDEEGKDIVNTNKILDQGLPCPPFCPQNGQSLNK